MAGLIKKQILKHLSKFAKNLSADSINLSTLKGEGELNNLELDCVAIQNLIDLPTWLQINHAKCNRVHVKIPWTKLKTTAITIFLDCVEMEMVTCEKPRPPNGPSPIEASASNGDSSYGFIEKVLEGITVRINSIHVNFTSAVFKAEFQLSQLLVYSTDPEGKRTDLRFTRIMNNTLGQVLTFKKITWQTMRVVTDAASLRTGGVNTPIRLITNQVTVEIELRRKVSDLSVLASKLHVKFDDLLWVLSDAQVQSALLCVKSIRETIERSRMQGRKRSESSSKNISPPVTPHFSDAPSGASTDPFFMRHVIHETSYHCDVDRLDLHICDDGTNPNKEASYKKVVEGGAILITLNGFTMDHYPYHRAGKPRNYFRGYNDIFVARDKWAEEIIAQFRSDFVELKKAAAPSSTQGSKLRESCLVFRLADIEIGQVTSLNGKERTNCKVVSSQRKKLHLPSDMPLASVFVTDYYYPDSRDYPAPHNNIYIKLTAPLLHAHWTSLLWANQLAMTTVKSVQEMLEDFGVSLGLKDPRDEDHVDIRLEALMTKIFIPLLHPNHDENFPDGIEINVSQAVVTNCRYGKESSRNSLISTLNKIKSSYINNNSSFPHDKGHDYDVMHHAFEDHAIDSGSPVKEAIKQAEMKRMSLIGKAYKDLWSVWLRQVWMEFVKNESGPGSKPKSFPFIDAVPLMLWICKTEVALPVFPPIQPCRTESLPCISPSGQGNEVRKTHSDYTISSPAVSNELDDATPRIEERGGRNKKLLDFYRQSTEAVEEANRRMPKISDGPAAKHVMTGNEKTEEMNRKTRKPIDGSAAKYILIDSEKPISLILDHHQFLFLLRLMESIGTVGEKVISDTATILSSLPSIQSAETSDIDSSGVRIFLPLINLFLILRPSSATHSSVFDPANQIIPVMMRDIEQSLPLHRFTPSAFTPPSVRSVSPSECSTPDNISVLGDDVTSLSFIPPLAGAIPVVKKRTDYPENDRSPLSSSPNKTKLLSDPATQLRTRVGDRLMSNLSGTTQHETATDRSTTMSSGYRTDSMDSVVTYATAVTSHDDNDSQSSGSLDQYVVLEMDPSPIEEVVVTPKPRKPPSSPLGRTVQSSFIPEQVRVKAHVPSNPNTLFTQPDLVETASTVPSNSTKKSVPEKQQVSLLQITAEGAVELTVDSHNEDSSVCIVAPTVSAKQRGNMPLDDAINIFKQAGAAYARSATSDPPPSSSRGAPSMRMRIDSGRCASRFYEGSDSHMQIEVHNFKETLLSSTLANLGAFLEDEKVPENLPMKIDAYDVVLTIENDEPPVYPNSCSGPPVVLNVHQAHVRRDNVGTFHVSTESVVAPDLLKSLHFSATKEAFSSTSNHESSSSEGQSTTDMKPFASCDSSDSEVASLRSKLEEMTRERNSLASALTQLQDELHSSNRNRLQGNSMFEPQTNSYNVKITS